MKKKFILPIVTLVLTLFGLGSCKFITHDHNYGDTWSHDDTHHWKVCTVEGCDRVSFKEEHVGGTATETEKAKCSVCGESYGSFKGHTHAYTVSKVDEAYLKDPATCETKAVYYKSCECGEKGTEFFTSDYKLDHNYEEEYSYDETYHFIKATCCDEVKAKAKHSGGKATCQAKAICATCNQEYGELADHLYDQEIVDEKYLAKEATCSSLAEYYKSCACGKASEDTFKTGSFLEHQYENAFQAPPSMGFSRKECWSGLPFPSPGDLPNPGIEPGSPALQADTLPSEPPFCCNGEWNCFLNFSFCFLIISV